MAKKKVKQNTGPPPITAVFVNSDSDGSVLIQTVGMRARGFNEIATVTTVKEINMDMETLKCIGREVYRKGTKLTRDTLHIIGDEKVPIRHVFKLIMNKKGDQHIPIDLDCIMVVKSGSPIESPVDNKKYTYDSLLNQWVACDDRRERYADYRKNHIGDWDQEGVDDRRSRLDDLRNKRCAARQRHSIGSNSNFSADALD